MGFDVGHLKGEVSVFLTLPLKFDVLMVSYNIYKTQNTNIILTTNNNKIRSIYQKIKKITDCV